MIPVDLTTFLLSVGGVILVDLILSGDNALVIGAAAAHIRQRRQRWLALALGGVGAILLRVLFTTSATFLLSIPYLQALGGVVVLVIAIRLLFDDQPAANSTNEEQGASTESAEPQLPGLARWFSDWVGRRGGKKTASENRDFLLAILTITIADITMSLDNIIAIGALAHQQVVVLLVGLFLSIVLLIIGSALVSELISRIPWLIIIASFILAWVSSDLVWNDVHNLPFIKNNPAFHIGLLVSFFCIVFVFTLVTRVQRFRAATRSSG
jgi:YjbE family integral membrane protein